MFRNADVYKCWIWPVMTMYPYTTTNRVTAAQSGALTVCATGPKTRVTKSAVTSSVTFSTVVGRPTVTPSWPPRSAAARDHRGAARASRFPKPGSAHATTSIGSLGSGFRLHGDPGAPTQGDFTVGCDAQPPSTTRAKTAAIASSFTAGAPGTGSWSRTGAARCG